MNPKLLKLTYVSALVWTVLHLSACAGLIKTHDKKPEAVAKIRTAALVAYSHEVPAAREIGLNLGSGNLEGSSGGSWQNQESPQATEIFEKTISTFKSRLNWNVMDSKKMLAIPAYPAAYKANMEGWHSRMPVQAGYNRFLVNKVMDYDSARIMEKAGRDKLMDDLKVDALIAIHSRVILNGTTVMGIGKRRPQTRITFFVYTKEAEMPVWFETLEGQEMESVGSTAFIDETKVSTLAVKSAEVALAKLGDEKK